MKLFGEGSLALGFWNVADEDFAEFFEEGSRLLCIDWEYVGGD